MSKHHQLIKNDPRWKRARADCLDRDGHACVRCGLTDGLEADHMVRLSEAPELAYDLDNLQTLCTECHDEKEREYQAQQLERREWINPRYPEIKALRDAKQEREDSEPVTLVL